jgi:uncharacterized protein (TIGR03435 family)
MLQALLENRFQLKIRRETREVPVYALAVAKGGPKLQAAQPGKCIAMDPDHSRAPSQRPPDVVSRQKLASFCRETVEIVLLKPGIARHDEKNPSK